MEKETKMTERGKVSLIALLASINTAVLLWALYNEMVNAIYVAFGYIAIMVLIGRIIETEGKDEMKNEELHGNGYMAAKSDDTAAKHSTVDKLTDSEQNAARNGISDAGLRPTPRIVEEVTVERFVKLLQKNCTIRHRDGQLEAVINYAKIEELAEKYLEGQNV